MRSEANLPLSFSIEERMEQRGRCDMAGKAAR